MTNAERFRQSILSAISVLADAEDGETTETLRRCDQELWSAIEALEEGEI